MNKAKTPPAPPASARDLVKQLAQNSPVANATEDCPSPCEILLENVLTGNFSANAPAAHSNPSQILLENVLERNFLADASTLTFCNFKERSSIHWMQITRLPVHPNEQESYDLLARWQGVLTSLHAWGYRFYFLLLRHDGTTKLFLGTSSAEQAVSAEDAVEQLREAATGSMPGIGLQTLEKSRTLDDILQPLNDLGCVGAVTGLPSLRESSQKGLLQTLDPLAFGIRDANGYEKDYAMLAIADPIPDGEMADIIARYRQLGSQVHTMVKASASTSKSSSLSYDPNAFRKATASVIGPLAGAAVGFALGGVVGGSVGSAVGGGVAKVLGAVAGMGGGQSLSNAYSTATSAHVSTSESASLNLEYLDKFAEYAETTIDHHIQRLNAGRSFGFWNAGVYVLGHSQQDITTIGGMLRSIYSGEESYFEPIRLHRLRPDSNARAIVCNNFDLIPLTQRNDLEEGAPAPTAEDEWHPFGRRYQYLSTPMNTRELSLATSLPRRDVPGLRFVKTAVRFANNPADIQTNRIALGTIIDTGIEQQTTYDIDVNSLVRHAFVGGSTGCGKSTTCKRLLHEVMRQDVPVLIIEPAKDDYVRWALQQNKHLPKEKQFTIYMPGVSSFEGHPVEPLALNPFQPAALPGQDVDLMQHCEAFVTLLNACLPSEDVVPILMEEAVFSTIHEWCASNGLDIESGPVPQMNGYPRVGDELLYTADRIMDGKRYFGETKDNLTEILRTRFQYLKRGTRGKILNVRRSTNFSKLFTQNVVINISYLSGTKEKALLMSLLLQALYEYRIAQYTYDPAYRRRALDNKLNHLTLIEEAHNVLLKPDTHSGSGSPQRAAADLFSNMLSEVRGYGQGFVIVDQVPTRLIDDVIKNTNYKIVHRLTAPDDQQLMAASLGLREDQQYILPALEKGNAIIRGDEDDAAAWVKIPFPLQ